MAGSSTATATDQNLSLRHLYAEMARMDVFLKRAVARLEAVQDDENQMPGLVISRAEVDNLFAFSAGFTPNPSPDPFEQLYQQAWDSALMTQQTGEAQNIPLRLLQLRTAFQLNPFEYDAFLICLAPSLDLRYEKILAYIQDDVTLRRPTVNGILQILVGDSEDRLRLLLAFLNNNRLLYHKLIRFGSESEEATSLLSRQLVADEGVVAWLLGQYESAPRLEQFIELHSAIVQDEDRLLATDAWPAVSEAINGQSVALFHGPDVGIQIATARLLAAAGDLPLMTVNLALAVAGGLTAYETLSAALRDARLTGALLFIEGWDVCLTTGAPAANLVKLLFGALNPVIVSSEKEWHSHGIERAESILRVTLDRPTYRQRLDLWEFFLNAISFPQADDVEIKPLASQFVLTSRQIKDAVYTAKDTALQRRDSIQRQDLIAAARAHSSPNLSGLAQKIEPRYDWGDLVLPEDQKSMLQEMVQTVKGRDVVMKEWGVGRKLKASAGVTVLFAGPPGTGKTMAAEVITKDLGLDLYKLDLSMVVSKYIGETEKNLGKIFDEAQSSSAVLFFDEADAIFGKRSEVKDSHDRYANMEVSYLLQRMEEYDGVTILATNLRANMDEAFTRRMQFIVDFPFPDEEERLHIWQTLFPEDLPQSADIDLALFASRFKLAGGSIRNIIVGAAYLAAANDGQVTMNHLLHSTRREMQKMGRLITDLDLTY